MTSSAIIALLVLHVALYALTLGIVRYGLPGHLART